MNKVKLSFVQILRGFAAIAVLMYHMDRDTQTYFDFTLFHFGYGFLGVDFFFVLSGFIITYNHLSDIQNNGSVGKFITKRLIRIYPIYWITLFIIILVTAPSFVEKPILRQVLSPFTTDGWIAIIKNIFLLPLPIAHMPVGVAWSLVYELIFYAVFAVCIATGWKTTRWIFMIWLGLIILNSRDVFPKSEWTQVILGNLIVEFFTGCIIGYLVLKGRTLKWQWMIAGLTAIGAAIAGYISWHPFNRYSIALTALIGAASALIIFFAATLDKSNKFQKLASPTLILIGDASYVLYLFHCLITPYLCKAVLNFVNAPILPIPVKIFLILVVFILNILIAVAIHKLVEKPLLKSLRKTFKLQQKSKPRMAL